MSDCRYCTAEVVWVPTVEGARPFNPPTILSSEASVVVMKRHDCYARKQFLAGAAEKFMQNLYRDPVIRSYALAIPCPNQRCKAEANYYCRDLRPGYDRPNKNPHRERLIEGARCIQEATE